VSRRPDRFHLGLLIVAAFLMDLAYRAGNQAYQEAGLSLHASAVQLSWLGAIAAFCYSTMCLVAGSVSDRIGRKASTLLACLGLALAYVVAGLVRSVHHLLALTVLSGSSLAYFWPAVQAWIADLSGRGRRRLARRLAIFNVSWSAGLAVGPTFTGFVWAFGAGLGLSQRMVFWSIVGAITLLAVIVVVVRARPRDPDPYADAEGKEVEVHPHSASLLFGARAGTFASWFAVGVIVSLFPKLASEVGFDARMRGLLASCYHVGQLGLFFLALYDVHWRLLRRWPLFVAEGLALVGMLSVVWAKLPIHFAAAFLLAGVCSGVAYTASLFHSLHGRVADRGKLAGVHEAVLASGVFLSPLIGGFLAQYISLRAPFVMVAAVFAGAIIAQVLAWNASQRAPA
jgi:MFS family permease